MPTIAIALCSLRTTDLEKLKESLKTVLSSLTEVASSLDIIITDKIHSQEYLDYVLGKLYSTTREVLLEWDLYETPINVMFNLSVSSYMKYEWDLLIVDDQDAKRFPHKQIKKVEFRKTAHDNERHDTLTDETPCLVSAVGGTFDHLHDGHKILLSAAAFLTTTRLIVGVTDEELLQKKKFKEQLESYETRSRKVIEFMSRIKPSLNVEVVALRDVCGPTGAVPEIESLIAVSYTHLDVYKRQH